MLQEKRENRIKTHFIGNEIQGVTLYSIENEYFATKNLETAITSLGIEIQAHGNIFSFGWNADLDLIDFMDAGITKNQGYHITTLDNINDYINSHIAGLKVEAIDFVWNYYMEADEKMNPIGDPNYIPVEIFIRFEHGKTLQLAATSYSIDPDTGSVSDFYFDSMEQVLVTINQKVKIEIPQIEE